MISYLLGRPVLEKDALTVIVGGVGYAVRVPEKVRAAAINLREIEVFVYTHVREDALELYGFTNRQDRDVFLLLIDVSGVGPKTALAIVNCGAAAISEAVQQADTAFFAAVPRVGKKLAQKIIIELRIKLGALRELDLGPVSPHRQEVVLALQSLGFEETAVHRALQQMDVESMEVGTAVKQGLKILTSQGS